MHTQICFLTVVFLTRISAVDMVLWDDIVTARYGQYHARGVVIQEPLRLLQGLGVYLESDKYYMWQEVIVPLRRYLSCAHDKYYCKGTMNYTYNAHKLFVP